MRFVQIRSFDNYIPAHLTLQRLEAEGIKAYLKDEHTVTIDPILTNAIGGIKLMVYYGQAERAVGLIEEYEKTYRESLPCPRCHSLNVQQITKPRSTSNLFSALLTWLLGSYAIAPKKVHRCFDCGHEFR